MATPNLMEVRQFFFVAMMNGYATKVAPKDVPRMPGFKEVEFHRDSWHCIDRWIVVPGSNQSAGATTIWYNDVPVWTMSYQGWYAPEVVDFLKLALVQNYKRGIFYGGRGSSKFQHPTKSLIYINSRSPGFGLQDFSSFGGREVIQGLENAHPFGYHDYMGRSLI